MLSHGRIDAGGHSQEDTIPQWLHRELDLSETARWLASMALGIFQSFEIMFSLRLATDSANSALALLYMSSTSLL